MTIHYNNIIDGHCRHRHWLLLLCLIALLCPSITNAQALLDQQDKYLMENWVEDQMRRLDTPEKQLGQLIIPMIYQGKGSYDTPEARNMIRRQLERYHIGGVVFSKSTIHDHAALTNYAQQMAYEEGLPPLLVCVDGEWGLNMRMSDAIKYPRNRDIGKIHAPERDTLSYLYGLEVARQCRLMGIHINFAPVLDIDSNPKNPVIGNRSYGNSVDLVTSCGIYYSHGLEDGGVMACAKHFPGHGDTNKDSHKTLPRLRYTKKELLARELKPFQSFISQNLGGVMIAHLDVPKLAEKSGMPSTASKKIVTNLLKEEMGFDGLVITDGLAMKGASDYPDICVKALLAGNDILLQPTPDEKQWQSLLSALRDGRLSKTMIAEKCRRVLRWKYTLIMGQKPARGIQLLPYPQIDTVGIVSRLNTENALLLQSELNRLSNATGDAGIDPTLQSATEQEEEAIRQELAQATASGQASQVIVEDIYCPTPAITLPTATPEEVGINSAKLAEVSTIANEVVTSGAAPGCQVLIMRKGKIIYDQTFGTQGGNLEQNPYADRPITAETLYDLASMSKATATVPAFMLLMSEHNIRFKDLITKWLPEFKKTKYAKVTVQDLLFHESGLNAGYFFYKMADEPNELLRDKQMIEKIATLKPRRKQGQYLYSDLNFVLLRYIIERVSGERLDQYLTKRLPDFFGPWLCYNPLEQGVPLQLIAPTEQDDAVRHRFIHGTVHDEIGAWSLGVEGNSGLFGSAEALAPLLQMMLNDGELNGKQYLPRDLCHQFTTLKSSHSRRGMGFDKPETGKGKSSPTADECSAQTWGHTGFTGTCFWVDPKQDLVYIFLSNRICPNRDNRLLMTENYRTRIQSVIYQAIKK